MKVPKPKAKAKKASKAPKAPKAAGRLKMAMTPAAKTDLALGDILAMRQYFGVL
jgi:hypothetical protein